MKLGIITDIHEHVEYLRIALDRFRQERVDQIVGIGDVLSMAQRIEETCSLLAKANVIGVWGNHDFGLCGEIDEDIRVKYPPASLKYRATASNLAGCRIASFKSVAKSLETSLVNEVLTANNASLPFHTNARFREIQHCHFRNVSAKDNT